MNIPSDKYSYNTLYMTSMLLNLNQVFIRSLSLLADNYHQDSSQEKGNQVAVDLFHSLQDACAGSQRNLCSMCYGCLPLALPIVCFLCNLIRLPKESGIVVKAHTIYNESAFYM